ncbi:alpha/beta hydrolase [Glycomyces sp. NPDC021274]|uniref:alpha/beta hydrolase n=1 Tax=Glycomyces sp. NPDC021274 TaxID=3155120 RepID=UPI003404E2D1
MDDAVVVPGGAFGPGAGMLMYAPLVAERRGATIHRHHWSALPEDVLDPTIEAWVRGEIAPLLDVVTGRPLLIGKSLGTNAAGVAAERGLPAIWLTPLLTLPWVVDAISRATAPVLLIGGTADQWWDGAVARRLSAHVLEVVGADHGMLVSGPAIDSISVLGQVITAIDDFLDIAG